MLDFIKSLLNFLLRLVDSHNTTALVIFTVILVLFCAAFLGMFWLFLRKDSFDEDFPLLFLRMRLYGGKGLRLGKRTYRKVLYVKVLYLADQRSAAAPFYTRTVTRAGDAPKEVPVFDEALYYTLKLFPDDRQVASENDHSSGTVDPRIVIPWDINGDQDPDTLGAMSQLAQMRTSIATDTMLSVSHFLNGMQGREQQFCTGADEAAGSLRIVVDFSSIPHAADFVTFQQPELWLNKQRLDTDNVRYSDLGRGVYMAHCQDAPAGAILRVNVTFNTWPADATKPISPCD